ncbi:MAG: hypothetical protein HQL51_07930 [Magnetococcales bacterium]|nr:hypothetical protein [Magnetococcales bacterium]
MSNAGCKPNGSGGDQPYDERGRYAGGGGCGSGGSGGSGGPGSAGGKEGSDAPDAPWWMKHLNLAPNGFPIFNYWDAGQEGMTLAESEKAMALKESLLQSWFDAAWARDGIALLREHGLLPEGVTAAGLITPLDAVLQAILAFLEGLPSLLLIGEADAAEAAKAALETPPIPAEKSGIIDPEDWDAFGKALDGIPGMEGKLKYAIMMTVAWEGGSNPNGDVLTGLTSAALDSNKTKERLPDRLKNLPLEKMTVSDRVEVIMAHLDASLERAGGLAAVREAFPDREMLSSVLDVVFSRGSGRGAEMLRRASEESISSQERGANAWPTYVDRKGNIREKAYPEASPETLERLKRIGQDATQKRRFLNKLEGERNSWDKIFKPTKVKGLSKRNRFFSFQ